MTNVIAPTEHPSAILTPGKMIDPASTITCPPTCTASNVSFLYFFGISELTGATIFAQLREHFDAIGQRTKIREEDARLATGDQAHRRDRQYLPMQTKPDMMQKSSILE